MSIPTTTTATAVTITAEETGNAYDLTVDELRVGNARYEAYRRDAEGLSDHGSVTINHVTKVDMYVFQDTNGIHLNFRDADGHGHCVALRGEDGTDMMALLHDAITNRIVL